MPLTNDALESTTLTSGRASREPCSSATRLLDSAREEKVDLPAEEEDDDLPADDDEDDEVLLPFLGGMLLVVVR